MVKKRRVTKTKIEIRPEDINLSTYAILSTLWRAYFTSWGIAECHYKILKCKGYIDKNNKLTLRGTLLAKYHDKKFRRMQVVVKEVSEKVKAVRGANVKKAQATRKAKKELLNTQGI